MSGRYTYKTSEAFCEALHKAGLLDSPDTVTRVIIDIQVGNVPIIYVTRIADDRLLDVLVDAGIAIVKSA